MALKTFAVLLLDILNILLDDQTGYMYHIKKHTIYKHGNKDTIFNCVVVNLVELGSMICSADCY